MSCIFLNFIVVGSFCMRSGWVYTRRLHSRAPRSIGPDHATLGRVSSKPTKYGESHENPFSLIVKSLNMRTLSLVNRLCTQLASWKLDNANDVANKIRSSRRG